ncbi:MAG: hypothetical protein P4L49_11860 [Desulfosporosinus sp.]|nr:hypothetical protein [Desulfosporosinus sp.]
MDFIALLVFLIVQIIFIPLVHKISAGQAIGPFSNQFVRCPVK